MSKGRRCGVRSWVWRPVMSRSSPASAGTGRAGSRWRTSYGSSARFVTEARTRSRPLASSSNSAATSSSPGVSVATARSRTAPSGPSGHSGVPASATAVVTASYATDQARPAREPRRPGRPSQPDECCGSTATHCCTAIGLSM